MAASRNHQELPRAGPGQRSRQEVRCLQQLFNSEIQGVGKVSPEIGFLLRFFFVVVVVVVLFFTWLESPVYDGQSIMQFL